jgi:acyl-lipid omega-6 desaturase (Delta-12 desaturase)
MSSETVPCPAALTHLRPADRHGLAITGCGVAVTAIAIWLSAGGGWLRWVLGQTLLGGALVFWFVVLHECGHRTLFRGRRLNALVGHVAGFVAMIPYHCWTRVHGRHHKWTGWQDLDPTTESLVPRPLSAFERGAVNVAWRLWLPLFSTLYRIENFWKLGRLASLFPRDEDRRRMRRNAIFQIAAYAVLVVAVGPSMLVRIAGLGVVLSLMVEDLLLLSQHTHIPQNVSHGRTVAPVPALEQDIFTRSIRLPAWISALLLHFDAHELHHMYPFVPGYHLRRIPYAPSNEIGWWRWVQMSKRLRGAELLFQNRMTTGFEV